jgi:hypothetical protein
MYPGADKKAAVFSFISVERRRDMYAVPAQCFRKIVTQHGQVPFTRDQDRALMGTASFAPDSRYSLPH